MLWWPVLFLRTLWKYWSELFNEWCSHQRKPDASSNNGAVTEKITSSPTLEPYHKIFLSHSGVQKTFVQQLCDDLVADTYTPFFDQRDDSLPKGEEFVDLIFKAARQCHVAVVVLSEDFLTSKWPMLEFVEFDKAKGENPLLKLLPLFYKLSINDIKNEFNFKRWKKRWESFAKKDNRINLSEWEQAFKRLQRVNGINFPADGSEKTYRKTIVETIWLRSPPDVPHDLDGKEGWERICKILSGMFVADEHVEKLGVHGMGGLGKTTICKGMCNYLHQEFLGRVFHLELGSELQRPFDLQKLMLKALFRLSDDILKTVSSFQQKHAQFHPVLLVIDNVNDDYESLEQAGAYLKANFHPGSKIMVMSRSQAALKTLFRNFARFCKPMPNLEKGEAERIFLRRAAGPEKILSSLELGDRKVLDTCLEQCSFSLKGDGPPNYSNRRNNRLRQYHPLALIALASYLARRVQDNSDLSTWEPYLQDFDNFKLSKDYERLFGILGMQLRTLSKPKLLIFFDVAIFSRGRVELHLSSYDQWVGWLAMVNHQMPKGALMNELIDLKDVGIIQWGNSAITTHDLYKEYAEWFLKKENDLDKDVWLVRHKPSLYGESLPLALERRSAPRGLGCWPYLERLWLEGLKSPCRFPFGKEQEWCNVVVLQLHSCPSLTILNLRGFSCLRHLELIDLANLETLAFHAMRNSGDICESSTAGNQLATPQESMELYNLQIVMMDDLPALKKLSTFTPCFSMQKLLMQRCPSLEESPSFQMCTRLETLQICWHPRQAHKPINLSTLTSLRDLTIQNIGGTESASDVQVIEGLGSLTQLETKLYFLKLPVRSLPGLDMLTKLRLLSLEHCSSLQELEGLDCLPGLEVLNVSYTKVKKLPGLDKLLQLRTLECAWCQELVWLPDLHELPNLQYLNTQGCNKLAEYPRIPSYPFVHSKACVKVQRKIVESDDEACTVCNESPCNCSDDPYKGLDSDGDNITKLFG